MALLPITQEGYEKLLKEHEHLAKIELPAIINKVAEARSLGDLRENAEYHAAREQQSLIQTKINDLRDKIARSKIMQPNNIQSSTIIFGSRVKIMDLTDESVEEYILVGEAEADPLNGKISTSSPIGKGLLGKKRDDVIEIHAPGGKLKFKILEYCPSVV